MQESIEYLEKIEKKQFLFKESPIFGYSGKKKFKISDLYVSFHVFECKNQLGILQNWILI